MKNQTYLDLYKKYFSPMRDAKINLLEISEKKDNSLDMWRNYFKNGMIYGIDISKKDNLSGLIKQWGKMDIIIDSTSHVRSDRMTIFESLFAYGLNDKGIYVIENISSEWINKELDLIYKKNYQPIHHGIFKDISFFFKIK